MILSNETANPPKAGDAKLEGLKTAASYRKKVLCVFGNNSTNNDKILH